MDGEAKQTITNTLHIPNGQPLKCLDKDKIMGN